VGARYASSARPMACLRDRRPSMTHHYLGALHTPLRLVVLGGGVKPEPPPGARTSTASPLVPTHSLTRGLWPQVASSGWA
jgi:hypothetical protein